MSDKGGVIDYGFSAVDVHVCPKCGLSSYKASCHWHWCEEVNRGSRGRFMSVTEKELETLNDIVIGDYLVEDEDQGLWARFKRWLRGVVDG